MTKGIPKSGVNKGWFKKGRIGNPNWTPNSGFQKGHEFYKGGEKGWFKRTNPTNFKRKDYLDCFKYSKTKWKKFREMIYERDNFTCRICKNKSKRLNAHHILGWSHYPELIFDEENVVTLCIPCHAAIHYLKTMRTAKRKVQEVMQ